MSDYKKNDQLDKEEKEILEAYENGKLNGAPASDSMVLAAKKTIKKI